MNFKAGDDAVIAVDNVRLPNENGTYEDVPKGTKIKVAENSRCGITYVTHKGKEPVAIHSICLSNSEDLNPEPHKCNCSLEQLMNHGCNCKGI